MNKYNKLKALIIEKGLSQRYLATMLGMSESTFNVKLNRYNGRDFTLEEAKKIAKILNEKLDTIFL